MSDHPPRSRCWVWIKGNPLKNESHWMSGWLGTLSQLGGIKIEHPNFVACRVPEWRVSFEEPSDLKLPPAIPEGATWKFFPVE
ncbi:MAG: hypothetical protein CL862_10410 [Cyanobium sp. NAT70]|nr:hypothetical protein [Cyanobium sp. NAT70]|tara:strand:+ start:1863 stop:2111 length:249 start_codon:yes stop_codon:yes gene_type:complete